MMRDKNQRQTAGTVGPDNWTSQNSPEHAFEAEFQSSTDISMVDVSSDGIGIKTKEPLNKDKIISFDLCFTNEYHRVTARVLWTSKGPSSWRSGLQILHMPEELMVELEDYLSRIEKRTTLN